MSELFVERIEDQNDFDRIANNMSSKIKSLGTVDYGFYKRELAALQKPLSNIFNPEDLAKDLAQVQAFKDRAVEIVSLLTDNYLTHKRVVDILTKGWPKLSNEKSVDRREGEALLKMSKFIMEANDADIAYRYAMLVMQNLQSQMDSVSRQITCAQAAAQINGGKYAFDNGMSSRENFDATDESPEVDNKQNQYKSDHLDFDSL